MQQELRGTHRTGHVFSIISKSMVAQGFSRTPEQCQTRLKRLKSSFRQCYQNKYVCLQQKEKVHCFCDLHYIDAWSLFPHCSLKGQEQVVCKFYNELGRILVKDFPIVPQLEDIPAQVEDGDFPAYSHREIGKHKCLLQGWVGRELTVQKT